MPYKSKSKSRRCRSRSKSTKKHNRTRSKRGGGVLSWFGVGSKKPDEQQPSEQPKSNNSLPPPPPTPEGGQSIPGRPQSQELVTPPTSGWFKSLFTSKEAAAAEPVAAEPVVAQWHCKARRESSSYRRVTEATAALAS
jgi:hypothetical protein